MRPPRQRNTKRGLRSQEAIERRKDSRKENKRRGRTQNRLNKSLDNNPESFARPEPLVGGGPASARWPEGAQEPAKAQLDNRQ